MDSDIKTEGIYVDVAEEKLECYWINERLIDGKMVFKEKTEFAALRLKNYSCLTDDNDENKKGKGRKKVLILLKKLKFEYYKSCLKATHLKKKTT